MKTTTTLAGTIMGIVSAALLVGLPAQSNAQTNNLDFNGISATVEGAIHLSWNSTSNEVYKIDYADSLIDTNTGTITWIFGCSWRCGSVSRVSIRGTARESGSRRFSLR